MGFDWFDSTKTPQISQTAHIIWTSATLKGRRILGGEQAVSSVLRYQK